MKLQFDIDGPAREGAAAAISEFGKGQFETKPVQDADAAEAATSRDGRALAVISRSSPSPELPLPRCRSPRSWR